MKKIVMSMVAVLCAVSFSNAQDDRVKAPPGAPNSIATENAVVVDQEYIETFRKDLRVNDDQVGRIKVLHTETVNRYNTIEPKYYQSQDVYQSRVQELINERDEKLRSILTTEQFSIYNANRSRYSIYDTKTFTDDLNQRKSLQSPEMRQAPADGQRELSRPQPTETRPVNPTPTMDNQQK